jgi:hypothetical protein
LGKNCHISYIILAVKAINKRTVAIVKDLPRDDNSDKVIMDFLPKGET